MTTAELRELIRSTQTNQGPGYEIPGGKGRAIYNALLDKVEELENADPSEGGSGFPAQLTEDTEVDLASFLLHFTDITGIGFKLDPTTGNISITPGAVGEFGGNVKIFHPSNGFASILSNSTINQDRGNQFPDVDGVFMIAGSQGIKQIPFGNDSGPGYQANEDFIYDQSTNTLGIGALSGGGIITSQTLLNSLSETLSDLSMSVKSANGGSVSGNSGAVNILSGNAQGGNGNSGDINIAVGNKHGSGVKGKINIASIMNLPTMAAHASINDGDVWREDNTDTGLKVRINGVTKTITVS